MGSEKHSHIFIRKHRIFNCVFKGTNIVTSSIGLAMKTLESSAGALTNFEVLDLLRSRGAGKDPSRVIASVSPSEFKVFDYLEQTPACSQSRDIINKFVDECKKFNLAKAEILNVVNIRPASVVEVFTIIEDCELRIQENMDEFIETIMQILPSHPSQQESNEHGVEDKEGSPEVKNAETAE